MQIIKVTDRLSIAAQPHPDDFEEIKRRGFASIINARPDEEEPGQPGNRVERQAAEGAGLRYSFIPVTGATITQADIDAFQAATAASDGPVLAHCKSGARALTLHLLGEGQDGRMAPQEMAARARDLGFDMGPALRWLERQRGLHPRVEGFFDPATASIQYIVSDPGSGKCAIIDPVLDFDEKSGATSTRSADALLAHVAANGLSVEWILDTHPHADHFSAAHYLKGRTG
ncbi:MAG: TIGR01244 family sulfur transferase, partial [Alphaproteobacteria bacterium]